MRDWLKRFLVEHVAFDHGELWLAQDVGETRYCLVFGHWRMTLFVKSGGWVGLPSGVDRVRALQLRWHWPPVMAMDGLVDFYARGG